MSNETYIMRCFQCDWGCTHYSENIKDIAREHLRECGGVIIAYNSKTNHIILFDKSEVGVDGSAYDKYLQVHFRV